MSYIGLVTFFSELYHNNAGLMKDLRLFIYGYILHRAKRSILHKPDDQQMPVE